MRFVPGLELSRRLYAEAVRPILERGFPSLPHAAALVGPGSDVLGFDTEMSTDHGWGPRLLILLAEADAHAGVEVCEALRQELPGAFLGYPICRVVPVTATSADPEVAVGTLRQLVWRLLAYDVSQPLTAADWLTFPSQTLRELTAGAVYHDGVGELTALRERLAYYPVDVWLYLLAAGWQRIGQEEHLMPRAGYVGDELGSALIGSRLVRDVMSLCFLMERQYAPYPKWYGTAFGRLACAKEISPALMRAQLAATWPERQKALGEAFELLARMHNGLGIAEPLPDRVRDFYDRPFKVIAGGTFGEAICRRIVDPEVKRIASRRLIGSIDQFSDSTDLRAAPSWRRALLELYGDADPG